MQYGDVVAALQKVHPFTIEYKKNNRMMQRIASILFFSNFMLSATTIGSTIYFPSKEWEERSSIVYLTTTLAHEVVHMEDSRSLGWWYWFLYFFPLTLIPFLWLLAFLIPWWGCLLLSIVCFLPLPSPRSYLEERGYRINLIIFDKFLRHWKVPDIERIQRLRTAAEIYRSNFNSSRYYWMNPFQRSFDIMAISSSTSSKRSDILKKVADAIDSCLLN